MTDVLEAGATRAARKTVADQPGISGDLILKWVNHADSGSPRVPCESEVETWVAEAKGLSRIVEY